MKLVSFSKLGTGHGGVGCKSDRLVLSRIITVFTEISYCVNFISVVVIIRVHFIVLTLCPC